MPRSSYHVQNLKKTVSKTTMHYVKNKTAFNIKYHCVMEY